jgi:hypothetical protein
MNQKIKKNVSSFGGFLDGYKASNIASIETALNYHLKEIISLLEEIAQITSDENVDVTNFLNRSLIEVKNIDIDIIERSISLGELINTFITIYRETIKKIQIQQKLKNITFHFLSLAEKSQDKELLSIAVKIGEEISKNYQQLAAV